MNNKEYEKLYLTLENNELSYIDRCTHVLLLFQSLIEKEDYDTLNLILNSDLNINLHRSLLMSMIIMIRGVKELEAGHDKVKEIIYSGIV